MNEDKELEEAVKRLNHVGGISFEVHETIETVLQALQNSIPKDIIRQKINERKFELQQEYKDFKDDIRLNTLQELYYYKED